MPISCYGVAETRIDVSVLGWLLLLFRDEGGAEKLIDLLASYLRVFEAGRA